MANCQSRARTRTLQILTACSFFLASCSSSSKTSTTPTAAPDPASDKIDELVRMRQTLAARGLNDAVGKLDQRIAALRAQRARAERTTPASAVLEISASRASPENQRMRMIFEAGGPPP